METPNAAGAVDTSPAVATPEPTIGSPEKMLDLVKAKLKEAATPKPDPKEPEKKPDETDLKVSPKVLREMGRLQAKVRELEPKLKDFDSLKTDADLAKEVKKLWNGTQDERLAALAKISGKDGLDALAELVKTFYEMDQENADGKGKESETAGANKELVAMIADLKKEIADLKTGKETEKTNAAKTEAEANVKKAAAFVGGFIEKNKATFELCARPENIAEATELAQDAALKIVEREKIDIKTMDQKMAEKIYLEALAEVESEFEQTGKRFSKTSATGTKEFNADRYKELVRPLSKPTVSVKTTEELSKDPKERMEQVRRKLIEKAEAGLFRR